MPSHFTSYPQPSPWGRSPLVAFIGTSVRGRGTGGTDWQARAVVDLPARALVVAAWPVRDTGLAPAPARHRRLAGGLRHHRGDGPAWPDRVELRLHGDRLEVPGVGAWPASEVTAAPVHAGPPLSFVLTVPGGSQLLATAATTEAHQLLAELG